MVVLLCRLEAFSVFYYLYFMYSRKIINCGDGSFLRLFEGNDEGSLIVGLF
jgi:hypothetical protein